MKKEWKKKISVGLIFILLLEMMPINNGIALPYNSYGEERLGTSSDAWYDERDEFRIDDESQKTVGNEEKIETYADEKEEFEIDENGVLVKYNGNSHFVTIPDNVISIGDKCFYNSLSTWEVLMSDNVKYLGEEAFGGCQNLKQIELSNSLISIGDASFRACKKLDDIILPESLKKIGSHAFYGAALKKITIPNNVEKVEPWTFLRCENLSQVILPEEIMYIDRGAFAYCLNLTQINIPQSVEKIGQEAFYNCRSLTQIEIPSSVTSIGLDAFECCSSLTQIKIPSSVTYIGNAAFGSCSSLTQIEISSSVALIEDRVFAGCSSLTQIEIPSSVISIGDNAFADCSSLSQIEIPNSVTSIDNTAFLGCSSLTIYCNINSYAETYAKENNIPYKIIGDDSKKNNVFILTKWDTEQNTPYFTDLNGVIIMENYHITNETDMLFVDSIDTLVGNPVLVQTDKDNNILSIKPAEKKIGTITAISSMSVTIDDTWYATLVTSNWMNLSMYIGKTCLAYVCEDQVGSLVIAEEKTGRLDGLNTGENKIIIDNVSYPMDLKDLSFLASIDLWLGKAIKFEMFDGIVYRIVTEDYETQYAKKVKSFDAAANTIYFEDGSLHVITDSSKFSPAQFVGKWAVYTLKTSIANGVEIAEMQELKPTVSVQLTLDDTRTIFCKNNQYAFDGGSYENSSSFKIPFTITISNSVKGVDKNILSAINDEELNITVSQLSVKQPNGFNFDWSGSGQVSFPESLNLKIGESWKGNGFLRPELFWVPDQEMTVDLECTAKVNNQDFHSKAEFNINNLDKNPVYSSSTRDAVEEYINKCAVQDIIKIPMGGLLTESQRQELNKVLSVWLTIINDQDINDIVKRSLFESYTKNGANSVTSSIIVPVHINNLQYGNLGVRNIRFTARLNDFGSPLSSMLHQFNIENMPELSAEMNSIQWKIVDTQGLPQMLTSGYIQVEANADLDALEDTLNKAVEKAKKDFQEAVNKAYEEVNLLNMLKEELIGQAVNGLVGGNLNPQMAISPYVASVIKETFSGIIWQNEINIKGTVESTSKEILKRACKKIFIKCPVDVYLYYNDELKGVIKNNQINEDYARLNVGSYMEIKGEDEKIIYLPDDSFSIKLVGTDSGSMDYVIEEYDGDDSEAKLLRTVYFDNLPLETGKTYTGNLEEGVKKDKKVYALQTEGKIVEADYDTMLGDKIENKPAVDNNGNEDNNNFNNNEDNNNSDNNGNNSNSNTGGHTGGRGGSGGGSGRTSASGNTGSWEQDNIGWWYKRKDGSWPANTWCQIFYNGTNEWYYFNEHGYMATGWIMDNGHWYYLNPISDGTQGKMLLGWQFIDGKWYYLNENSDGKKGALFVNTWIGEYYVDQNGVWVN